MQSVEVRIRGAYWDTYIYDNRLYLFRRDGGVEIYDWDRLLAALHLPRDQAPIAAQMLSRAKAWYQPELRALLRSPLVHSTLQRLLDEMCGRPIVADQEALSRALISCTDSPYFPHASIETYYNRMYLGGSDGIFECHLPLDDGAKITDLGAIDMAGAYGSLAVAGGTDGLWEQGLNSRYWAVPGLRQVGDATCFGCSWSHSDIVANSSDNTSGYIAAFAPDQANRDELVHERDLLGLIRSEQLFGDSQGYLVGSNYQVILIGPNGVEGEKWNPYVRKNGESPRVATAARGGHFIEEHRTSRSQVIDASVTIFGVVFEDDNGLVIRANDSTLKRLAEPINWKCFPRSSRYFNHLHVTYQSHVRIRAFTHDYFLDSRHRGISVPRPRRLDSGLTD